MVLLATGGQVEFRLFGELEVLSAGRSLAVGTPRQQAVLAVLVVDARRPVAIDTLVNRVWGNDPPANPRAVLYSHLSRIRRLLGPAVCVERRPAGYVLDLDPDLVDLHRFRRLVDEGCDRRRDDGVRVAALTEALGLWRGQPLAGLCGEWAAQVRDSWNQRRLDAVVEWAELELRLGHPAAVIAALPDLAAEHPLVEPIETLLMQALHTSGRGAEALQRYSAVRQRLAAELGADPGPELRAVHQAILTDGLSRPAARNADGNGLPTKPDHTAGEPARPQETRRPRRSWLTRRRTILAAVFMVVPGGAWSVHVLRQGNDSPPVEQDQELAVTGVVQALGRAGVDFSVPERDLRSWLANPLYTPYPAISEVILRQGWRFTAPVHIDVIVWNYEDTPGAASPREVADVDTELLKAAIVEASNGRHGTQVTDFEQLLDA
jgi:DNA-binding SARP family transcriptional activator